MDYKRGTHLIILFFILVRIFISLFKSVFIFCIINNLINSVPFRFQAFFDKDLEVDPARLYATTTKADIESAAGIFADQMRSMVIMIVIISTLIFVVVMYLMMKVMIDRSAFSISLIKVFGFRTKEIRKLYLDGNFFIIAIGAAICLPLAKLIMSAVYPSLVSNVNCGVKLTFAPWLWAVLYCGILVLYFIINRVLVGRLNKIVPAEVLKNRE